jgi:hypothetical protein
MELSGPHKQAHNRNSISIDRVWRRIDVTNVTLHVRDDATAYITTNKLIKFQIKTDTREETAQE